MAARRRLTAFAALATVALVASCDDAFRPPTVGSIAPRIELVTSDPEINSGAVTQVRATVNGPTNRLVNLTLVGGFWEGRADSLIPGTYIVTVEGLEGGEVEYFGRVTNVSVAAGQTASPSVTFPTVKTVVRDPSPPTTTNFTQRMTFAPVTGATGYAVSWSRSATFASGVTEQSVADTIAFATVSDTGTWYIRSRAVIPNTSSGVKWSDAKSFRVLDDGSGRSAFAAGQVNLTPGAADSLANRNVYTTSPAAWFVFAARAGDSLFAETFAARLSPASPLNTVLTLFQNDGATQLATNDNAPGTTDSRIVMVLPSTDSFRLRVTGTGGTVGHFSLVMLLKRLPAPPTTLTATTVSGTRIDLAWSDNADNEDGFRIERCANAGCTNFTEIATVGADVELHEDGTAVVGQHYRYRVRAFNAVGNSAYSNIGDASTMGPIAPSALTATTVSGSEISLTWADNSADELGFRIERCDAEGCNNFGEIATVGPNVNSFQNAGLAVNTTYSYRVRAYNVAAPSGYSNVATASTALPGDPTILIATTVAGDRIDLGWQDNSTNELGFEVQRCGGAGCSNFGVIDTVAPNTQAYQNTGLAVNNDYSYRVRAFAITGPSGFSNLASANTHLPLAPSALTAMVVSGTRVDLQWSDNSGNEQGFRIERCTGEGCDTFAEIASVAAGVTTHQDNTVAVDESYAYRVRAFNVAGNSDYSNTAATNTLRPAAPSDLAATTLAADSVRLDWNDNSDNEAGFQVERCTGAGCTNLAVVDSTAAGATQYYDTLVTVNTAYRYVVRAFNQAGVSAPTDTAAASTALPIAPTGLTATTVSPSEIQLAWTDNAVNETGYYVERCTGDGCTGFGQIAALGPGANSYLDGGRSLNTAYRYRVRAYNVAGNSGYSNIADANTNLPLAPSGLTATPASATEIEVSWTDNSDNEDGFVVERCTGPGCADFAEIAQVGAGVAVLVDNSAVTGNHYCYRVRALNAAGSSDYSDVACTTADAPAAPTGLAAATISSAQVDLSWNDASDNEAGFEVERCLGVDCSDFTQVAQVGAGERSYSDSDVVVNQVYNYRVRAFNAVGASDYSNEEPASTVLPAAPTTLVATAASNTLINLTWTDNADNESGYYVERCQGAGCVNFAPIDTIAPNLTSYGNPGLDPAVSYSYRIRAFNAAGVSDYSNVASAATDLPAPPTDLTATTTSPNQITLGWTDNANNETGFVVERCAGVECGDFAAIATPGANATGFVNSGLAADQSYSYRVLAFNSAGPSLPSNVASANTSLPAAPTGLSAATITGGRIDLEWSDNASNENGYSIERCAGPGCSDFAPIATLDSNSTAYPNTGLDINETYSYRVRAFNAVGTSDYSNEATANTILPADPDNLAANTVTASLIELTWNDNADNEHGYSVERCAGSDCTDFTEHASLPPGTMSFQDTDLTAGTSYTYRVRAFNDAGFSGFTNEATATTILPAAPTALTALSASSSSIQLQWTDNAANENGYSIESCTGLGCSNFAPLNTVATDVTSYLHEGTVTDQFYSYRVRAFNNAGVSPYSNRADESTFLPLAPSGLSATTTSGSSIQVAWTDNASNEHGFRIERCVSSPSCADFALLTTVPPNTTSYADLDVSINNTYRYRVRAFNGIGSSAYTNIGTANTILPADPTDLEAETFSATRIDLSWSDNSNNEQGFRIERCAGVGCSDFTERATVPAGTESYQDTGLDTESYTYRVVAFNVAGESGFTGAATATTFLPADPTDLVAVAASPTRVDLTWSDNADNEQGYRVERCTGADCTDFAEIASLGANATDYQSDGLSTGEQYSFRVIAFNAAGVSAYTNTSSASPAVPNIPSDLVATTVSGSDIELSWTDNSDNEDGFRIERCAGAGCTNFAEVATVGADVPEYADGGLDLDQRYSYRVRAFNVAGNSAVSNVASANTLRPAIPTDLMATTADGSTIDLAWTDASDNELGFRVERCAGDSCDTFAQVADLGAGTTAYQDTGLDADESYSYRVLAYNIAGQSDYSNTATANTRLPDEPENLTATTFSAIRIDLAWEGGAQNVGTFRIERCLGDGCGNGDFEEIASVPAGTFSYQNTGLFQGMSFNYRVRSQNAVGFSGYSNEAAATTNLPADPTDLVATTVSGSAIDLTWSDNAGNELGYRVERCSGEGCDTFAEIADLGEDANSYSDAGLEINTSYTYRVQAYNAAGNSAHSNEATANTFLPADPTLLTAITMSASTVQLEWSDNSNNETQFRIERCQGAGCSDFAELTTVGVSVSDFLDEGLPIGESFSYRVRASNVSGFSGYTNVATATTLLPADPTDLVATTASGSVINLTWADNADNEFGYRIERCTGAGCTEFSEIGLTGPDATFFAAGGLSLNQTYSFQVRAYNAVGTSSYTNTSTANTIVPADPTGLTATTLSGSTIELNWTDNSDNEAAFRIERCIGVDCEGFIEITTVGADVTTYQNTGLSLNLTYTYRVRASNVPGASGYTNTAAANTIVPATPTGFAATTISGTQIDLSWVDNATNETGYRLERCLGSGCTDFALLVELGANATSHSDLTVEFDNVYRYRVHAFNIAGVLGQPIITGSTVLSAPTSPGAAPLNRSQISLIWTDNATFETAYRIERCAGEGCSGFAFLTDVAANSTSFTNSSLAANTTYRYRIQALSAAGNSAYSAEVQARTPMVLTSGQTITGLSDASQGKRTYVINVPAGMSELRVRTYGGTGDGDIFVNNGSMPAAYFGTPPLAGWVCTSRSGTNTEQCVIASPAAGDWFVMLHAFSPYSGLTLEVTALPLVLNGFFDAGTANWAVTGSWVWGSGSAVCQVNSTCMALGTDAAGNNINGASGQTSQFISIPASANAANLTFGYRLTTEEPATTIQYDNFYVRIYSEGGALLATLAQYSNVATCAPNIFGIPIYCGSGNLNLLPWAGLRVRLVFEGFTDFIYPTRFVVDNVTVSLTWP
jgi:hypothetical protein